MRIVEINQPHQYMFGFQVNLKSFYLSRFEFGMQTAPNFSSSFAQTLCQLMCRIDYVLSPAELVNVIPWTYERKKGRVQELKEWMESIWVKTFGNKNIVINIFGSSTHLFIFGKRSNFTFHIQTTTEQAAERNEQHTNFKLLYIYAVQVIFIIHLAMCAVCRAQQCKRKQTFIFLGKYE